LVHRENEILKETLDQEKANYQEQIESEKTKNAALSKQLSTATTQLNQLRS